MSEARPAKRPRADSVEAKVAAAAVADAQAQAQAQAQADAQQAEAFSVTVTSPLALKDVLRNVSNVLTGMPLKITAEGLSVDSRNRDSTSLCKVRFPCRTGLDPGATPHFVKVNVRALSEIVNKVGNNVILRMFRLTDAPDLTLQWEDSQGAHHFSVKCHEEPAPPIVLRDIDSKFTVEIDLATLRGFCRLCRSPGIKANDLRIQLMERGATVFMQLSFAGPEAGGKRLFVCGQMGGSLTATEAGIRLLRAPESDFVSLYDHSFGVAYVEQFLKGMDKDAKVSVGLTPGKPLVATFHLGAPGCFVSYILAPK